MTEVLPSSSEVECSVRYEEVTLLVAGVPVVLSVWHGEVGGPVVVFLPGTMTHPLFYEEFCAALASQGATVVGVHFEGHGKSPRQRRVLRLEYLVDDVAAAVAWATDRFGCRPVVLGSSQGGILAMAAATRGVRVAGVIAHNVLDPALPDSLLVSRFPRWLRHIHRPLQAMLRLAGKVAPRLPVPFQLYLDIDRVCREPWTKEQFLSDPLGLRSYPLAFVADLFTVDLSGMGDGSIRCPVVVVAGSGDPLFSLDYSRAVFERIVAPHKQLRIIESDHHLLFNECIDQVLGPVAADVDALAADERRRRNSSLPVAAEATALGFDVAGPPEPELTVSADRPHAASTQRTVMTMGRSPRTPLDDELNRFVARLGVPGAGFAIIDADGTLDAAFTGTTRRGHTEPVTLDHQWHIGSCTKSITAAMYALLVERGRARWDAPVTELVPDLADDLHPDWKIPTVDEVLQCRAGVRPNLSVRELRQARSDTRSQVEQRTATARDVLRAAPARHGKFRYSNLGYVVVGAAIDRLAGSYEQAMHELILDPLGIDSAGFGPPPDIWGHQARLQLGPIGIGRGRPSPPARPESDNPEVYTPAGRLHLSLPDWATIVRRLFLDADDRLLTAESIDRLLHVPVGNAMAMGWAASPKQMPRASAAMQGSNTFWAATGLLDTDRRRAVLLVTNDGRPRVLSGSASTAHDLLAQCHRAP